MDMMHMNYEGYIGGAKKRKQLY